jgi:hypothetical protein
LRHLYQNNDKKAKKNNYSIKRVIKDFIKMFLLAETKSWVQGVEVIGIMESLVTRFGAAGGTS